jgi:6-phosphofructo-2-kinase/fructose-2,6-biphosphatase 2
VRERAIRADNRGQGKADHSAKYFSHSNEQANLAREKLAEESLEALIAWLKKEGNVGIMGGQRRETALTADATNSTFERR